MQFMDVSKYIEGANLKVKTKMVKLLKEYILTTLPLH